MALCFLCRGCLRGGIECDGAGRGVIIWIRFPWCLTSCCNCFGAFSLTVRPDICFFRLEEIFLERIDGVVELLGWRALFSVYFLCWTEVLLFEYSRREWICIRLRCSNVVSAFSIKSGAYLETKYVYVFTGTGTGAVCKFRILVLLPPLFLPLSCWKK